MDTTVNDSFFDYIIIGSGLAGLHLAMAMHADPFFKTKRIAIFDKGTKNDNDKTFCFWEQKYGLWDTIVESKWNEADFFNNKKRILLNLDTYFYKKIPSLSFYKYCINTLKQNDQFVFLTKEVISTSESLEVVTIKTNSANYSCKHLFDSRIDANFTKEKENHTYIAQSFLGWEIKADRPVFDSSCFTMMDYRFRWKNSTSFMYILPKSCSEALIEYTFFAPFSIKEEEFEQQIIAYLACFYPNTNYTITATEKGVIPMTSYPFLKHNTNRTLKIGTAGGWVKSSSGYSFKRAEKATHAIVSQIKSGAKIEGIITPKRFKFYDNLFLRVLANQNKKGAAIFSAMYQNTKPSLLFKFLDEETTLPEEIKIILTLPYLPFIKALFQKK